MLLHEVPQRPITTTPPPAQSSRHEDNHSSGIIIQPFWQSLYCHMQPSVQNYAMHQTYQIDLQEVWLDESA